MQTDNYLPVTREQSLETKISQSVKISKQLMKAELKKRMDAALEEYQEARRTESLLSDSCLKLLQSTVKRQVEMGLQNDSEITRFRNLFNKFSAFHDDPENGFKPFLTNTDLLRDFDISGMWSKLSNPTSEHNIDFRQKFLSGESEVAVDLNIVDRIDEDEHYNYFPFLGYIQPIGISDEVIGAYKLYAESFVDCKELNNKYNTLEKKLNNLDTVTEEMEARLLVQELTKSDEGKQALNIAGELVGEMLGDVPALLASS